MKKFWFLATSHWVNFHVWGNAGANFGFWKFKQNLEDWNHPRWLFQHEYQLEELNKHNLNNEHEYNANTGDRYNILSWIIIIIFLFLYQIIGILSLFILPINIYLFIFKNEQKINMNYKKIKILLYNVFTFIFGKIY